jgi:predicted enzyme related to lactoylglutathione lyase
VTPSAVSPRPRGDRSPAAARSFYHGPFGWRTEIVDTESGGPLVVLAYNGATLNASFFVADNGEPAHWRPCFTVESTEAAVERVRELGGTVLVEPEDNVDGRLAVALDPHGAPFALFAGEIDP